MTHRLTLQPLAGTYAICRLDAAEPVPAWAVGEFVSITRTPEELSIVCAGRGVPEGVKCERGWVAWRLAGSFDLNTATGVLASVAAPLAGAGIGIFVISTFNTDYLLVKEDNAGRAAAALRQAGHQVK
jgi:hypothetical protein